MAPALTEFTIQLRIKIIRMIMTEHVPTALVLDIHEKGIQRASWIPKCQAFTAAFLCY